MGKFLKTQNSFALGEISPEFFARGDLDSATHGLAKLENMDVLPSGAISRRAGLARIAEADSDTIILSFSESETESYLLLLSDRTLKIMKDGELWQNLNAPWTTGQLRNIQYASRFGTMIFVHQDFQPIILKKLDGFLFTLSCFDFSVNDDNSSNIPFMKFDDMENVKLYVTSNPAGNNFATVTATAACWTADNIGGRLLFAGKQWVVSEYVSPTVIVVHTSGTYTTPPSPFSDWKEAAFGARRGWPRSITFHQDRLVFGGSRDWPCGLWLSKVGDHKNFNVGTGLDDEAIFITLLSEKQQQICTVVSSENLQILTGVGEWAISSKPLTPSTIDIRQHTSVGCFSERHLPPQKIEGSTVFVSKNGKEIRELILDNLSEIYSAVDLCVLSSHLMKGPISIAYHDRLHRLFIPMADGSMAVLSKNVSLSISAWSVYKTQGDFKSVAVLDDNIYVIVHRDTGTFLECFSDELGVDSGGFGYAHRACGMPPFFSGHAPKKIRLFKLSARVLNTKSLYFSVDGYDYRAPLPNEIQMENSTGYSGDTGINLLGTNIDTINPLWEVKGDDPLPSTLLSVTVDGRYSI